MSFQLLEFAASKLMENNSGTSFETLHTLNLINSPPLHGYDAGRRYSKKVVLFLNHLLGGPISLLNKEDGSFDSQRSKELWNGGGITRLRKADFGDLPGSFNREWTAGTTGKSRRYNCDVGAICIDSGTGTWFAR
ncbi:hypothetical protein CDAR_467311 [Caerostris darwini]|uniref:Uncharacterized protein n=1 Tax=Caerostris darwini TaxID=1538125 RepID=A0AAV4U255_9ARAC|nr:hypothetical protein CDAR_467311 [Caerostris darwini]